MGRIRTIRFAKRRQDELHRGHIAGKRLQRFHSAFPPMRRTRSRGPFAPPAAWLRSTAARDSDECEFQRPFRWRSRQGRLPRAIPRRDQFDSWLVSESKRNSKITRAAIIAIVTDL